MTRPAPVADRKHDPPAEIIERLALSGSMQQPSLDQQRLGIIGGERAAQRLPVVRRPAEAKAADGLDVKPARRQIIARRSTGRRPQPRLVKAGGRFEGFEQGLLPMGLLALLGCGLRDRQPGFARQFLDRFEKVEIVGAHDETDRVAMRPAAKAVEEILVFDDVEGRRLFVVKRAQTGKLATAACELHAAPDQPDQRNATAQLVEKTRRKRHYVELCPRFSRAAA